VKLVAGGDGRAAIAFAGKGAALALPDPATLVGPIDVQLRRSGTSLSRGARFGAPFKKDAGGLLQDKSD
jgi:hypothetical protein